MEIVEFYAQQDASQHIIKYVFISLLLNLSFSLSFSTSDHLINYYNRHH